MSTPKQHTLDWNEFHEKFRPMVNKFGKDPDNFLFETYGDELDFVLAQDEKHVWTYLDVDFGSVVVNGFHYINRIGYYISELPWVEDDEYEVDFQPDTCDNCDTPFADAGYNCDGLCVNCCDHEDERDH